MCPTLYETYFFFFVKYGNTGFLYTFISARLISILLLTCFSFILKVREGKPQPLWFEVHRSWDLGKQCMSNISWKTVGIYFNFVIKSLKTVLAMHLSCMDRWLLASMTFVISWKSYFPIHDFFFLQLVCVFFRLPAEVICHILSWITCFCIYWM